MLRIVAVAFSSLLSEFCNPRKLVQTIFLQEPPFSLQCFLFPYKNPSQLSQQSALLLESIFHPSFCFFPSVLFIMITHAAANPHNSRFPHRFYISKGGFLKIFSVLYSTLLQIPPLRFHCVRGYWDRTQDSCDFGISSQTFYPLG
jgi:hypothetical protein